MKVKKDYVIGRRGFAKVSAVEGIVLSTRDERIFALHDRQGLSPAERRAALHAVVAGES